MAAGARFACALLLALAATSAPAPAAAIRLPWVPSQNGGGGGLWSWFSGGNKQAGSQKQDQKQNQNSGNGNSKSRDATAQRSEFMAANSALQKDPNYSTFNRGGNTLSRIVGGWSCHKSQVMGQALSHTWQVTSHKSNRLGHSVSKYSACLSSYL